MLAVVGFVLTEFFQLPGDVHHVSVVEAHNAAVKSGAMNQILLWTGIFEVISFKAITQMIEGNGRKPGDFGFDPLKFSTKATPAKVAQYEQSELKNGRLAM